MMEGNNDIFLPGDDALGYVAGPTHDKYFMTFIARPGGGGGGGINIS